MNKGMYLTTRLKCTLKACPAILSITAIMILLLLITASALISNAASDESKQKTHVGMVGDFSNTYLDVGMYALQNFDDSRFIVDLIQMDEETAQKSLRNGEISCYVVIPNDFADGLMSGENVPIKYVSLNEPVGINTALMNEVVNVISGLITESQSAVYGMQKIAHTTGFEDDMWEKIKDLDIRYIKFIMSRSDILEIQQLGIADSITTGGYYVCGMITIFLLLWGIACSPLLVKRCMTLPRFMKSQGYSVISQIFSEYFAYFLFSLGTVLILVLTASIFLQNNSVGIKELVGMDVLQSIFFVIKIIPVIAMITAMQLFLYELVNGVIGSVLLQFITALGMAYISGCLYPSYFFPEGVQCIGRLLPSGEGFAYIRQSLVYMPELRELVIVLCYCLLFLILVIITRSCRMAGKNR